MKRFQKVLREAKADEPRTFLMSRITFAVCFFVSVGLVIAGFVTPPIGVIDGSCLTAVGELLLFPTLLYAFRAIELGLTVKFNHGDTSIEITPKKQDIEPLESSDL
jgi:predicted Kef-type K+ transport protein